MINEQSHINFEMDTKHELVKGEIACDYSYLYQSIMGEGDISFVTDYAEKVEGLQCIMSHYTEKADWKFTEQAVKAVEVVKLIVTNWSCKEH